MFPSSCRRRHLNLLRKSTARSSHHKEVNLGKLQLKMSGTMMEAVEISAERSMVEYQLDKRVVNVDKNIVACFCGFASGIDQFRLQI